jgi:phosphoribosylglycinamide formyltransferase-1
VRTRIAVLASGAGSNLQSILDYLGQRGEERGGDVVLVASDRPGAGALERAAAKGVTTSVIATDRQPGAASLDHLLARHQIDLVVLAGYLRLVPRDVVRVLEGRVMNVHPALLPAFGGRGMYGRRVHEAVLASGATVTGVTVHFIDEDYDRGHLIAQWPVPVLQADTPDSLAARVLRVEHALLPRVVDAVAAGRIVAGQPARLSLPANSAVAFSTREAGDQNLIEVIERGLSL